MDYKYLSNTSTPSKRDSYLKNAGGYDSENSYSPTYQSRRFDSHLPDTLQPKSPSRLNSQQSSTPSSSFHALPTTPPHSSRYSPSNRNNIIGSSEELSRMKSSSTYHFRNLATNTERSPDPNNFHIPGVTDATEDVTGKYK